MLVEIRPLPLTKWHGKKGKESFTQPKTVEVLPNVQTGKYDTGLDEEQTAKYSKITGLDLSDTFIPDVPHPFWSTKAAWIPLPNNTLVLNSDNNFEYIKIANCKTSKYVANSMAEYNQGLWPDATHVIFSEEEEMELRASKFQIQQKASVKLMDYSLDAKIALVQILSKKTVKGRSANFIDGLVSELVENEPAEVLRVLNMNKEEATTRANVLEMLSKNVLTQQGEAIFYMGNPIGFDYEDAVKYFQDPNHVEMKVRLLEKIRK